MEGFSLLNKAFDSRVRLGLMSILSVNDWISYKEVKNLLVNKLKLSPKQQSSPDKASSTKTVLVLSSLALVQQAA